MAFVISLQSTTSDILAEYPEGIDVKSGYEVALKSFVSTNNIPNIGALLSNNKLTLINHKTDELDTIITTPGDYDDDDDDDEFTSQNNDERFLDEEGVKKIEEEQQYVVATAVNITLYNQEDKNNKVGLCQYIESYNIEFETGTYELEDIKSVIEKDPHYREHKTNILIDYVRMRVGIHSLWSIDFTRADSIGPMLGFEKKLYNSIGNTVWSTLPVQLFHVNIIRVKTNLTYCNVHNDNVRDSTLYEFPLDVAATEKIIERPIDPEYYKVNPSQIFTLRVSIVDQDGRSVDFRGELIDIKLHFRPALY